MKRATCISAVVLAVLAVAAPIPAGAGPLCFVSSARSQAEEPQRVATVTLHVAGMMKSRSGAT